MRILGRTRLIGAYVCPRGVFAIVCKRSGAGVEVERAIEQPLELEGPVQAADQLIAALRQAGIKRGDIAVAMRGFGVVHHVLQLPPATDDMLVPIIEREVRRLEPQLDTSVVGWSSLPPLESGGPEIGPQRSVLAAAAPSDVVQLLERRLNAAGYRLAHLTPLPGAMQRLLEEFEDGGNATAMLAPLPDGAFLGFSLNGGLRLIVEPPLAPGAEHDASALAEEVELGTMFVRQQFRGAQVDRISIVGSIPSLSEAESVLTDRVHIPAKQLDIRQLSPAALAAFGAVIDSQSAKPLTLGGVSRYRSQNAAASALESASIAAVVVMFLVGAWTTTESLRAKRLGDALQVARRRVEQDSFGLSPIRSTAGQRRLVRNAAVAMRVAADDRLQLQEILTGVAAVARPPVLLDSLHLRRADDGWTATLGGSVGGATNARAVETLHEVYRELPLRLSVDSMKLDELAYSDSARDDASSVRFQLSFGILTRKKD